MELPESEVTDESPIVVPPTSAITSLDIEIIPEKPNHPVMSQFPLRTFGKQKRAFCSSWYQKYPWLHYREASDDVFCFHCHVAERRHLPISLNKDEAFIKSGFSNWKKTFEIFNKHEQSMAHRQAVDLVEKIPSTTRNVGDMLSHTYAQQKAECREMLRIILSSIRVIPCQINTQNGRPSQILPKLGEHKHISYPK